VDESERYERAKARVAAVHGFYVHAAVYALVNLGLLLIDVIGTAHYAVFLGTGLGWGIGLAIHAYSVFGKGWHGLSGEWRERRIRAEMERGQPGDD
jgi:two-component system, LytTR family, sensor kinase